MNQVIPFQPGLKINMLLSRREPPQASKIPLTFVSSNAANRRQVFKVSSSALDQKTSADGRGKLFLENQRTCRKLGLGITVERQQRPSHGTNGKRKTPKCLTCNETRQSDTLMGVRGLLPKTLVDIM